jgi:hypothetical protein
MHTNHPHKTPKKRRKEGCTVKAKSDVTWTYTDVVT